MWLSLDHPYRLRRCTGTGGLAVLVAILTAAAIAGWGGRAGAAEAFVAGLEDVPLPPGFSVVADATTVFDKPSGRIVQSYATGHDSAATVLAFYDRAMEALGWTRLRAGHFLRDGELLRIEILGVEGKLTVRYALAPQP